MVFKCNVLDKILRAFSIRNPNVGFNVRLSEKKQSI